MLINVKVLRLCVDQLVRHSGGRLPGHAGLQPCGHHQHHLGQAGPGHGQEEV